jgi:5'-nucleotidase
MILLINDDGIEAPGLRRLYTALREITGQAVMAVAPLSQRSGQSHAITLDRGLAVTPHIADNFFGFSVDGTPTDCVKIGITVLCSEPPQLVVSGINDGPNTGRSIFYSGTVAAAVEGAIEGYPALAVSRDRGDTDFADAATFAAEIAKFMLERGEFTGQVVNLNLPATPASTWRAPQIVAHGRAGFSESYRPVRDAHERVTWHLHGVWTADAGAGETDSHLLRAGHPVLTTLAPDFNGDQKSLQKLLGNRKEPRAIGTKLRAKGGK